VTCPKCGEDQPPRDACRRCGLLFELWRGPEALADASELPIADVQELAARWKAVETGWADGARHEAFVAACRRVGAYGYGAARYRSRAAAGDPVAGQRLAEIRLFAETALVVPARDETPSFPVGRVIAIAGLLVIVGIALWFIVGAILSGRRPSAVSEPPHAAPPPVFRPDRAYGTQ
jgi:hypothetical protein